MQLRTEQRRSTIESLWKQSIKAAFWLVLGTGVSSAHAATFPSGNAYIQTSGQDRAPGIGDWYTSSATGSTDRVHRFIIQVTQDDLDAGGGTANITINDAESASGPGVVGDEVNGTSDPTRFRLFNPNGSLVSGGDVTVPSASPNGTAVVFSVNAPGSYVLTSVTGSIPVYGARVGTDQDNDDNSYTLTIPGNNILIGSLQTTFQHTQGSSINKDFYFLVGPGETSLYLRNFDFDTVSANQMVYTRPNGTTVAGTGSPDGRWNGAPPQNIDTGGDTISSLNTLSTGVNSDSGLWQFSLRSWSPANQVALEANGTVTGKVPLFDQPPSTQTGNYTITPDGTLETAVGVPVDHPFVVSNLFFTTDIINFTLSNTNPTYTVQLLKGDGTALSDTDGDGNLDTGVLSVNQTANFILRTTPNAGSTTSDQTRVTGASFMNKRVNGTNTFTKFITKTTTLPSAQGFISGFVYLDEDANASFGSGEIGSGLTGLYAKLILVENGAPAANASQFVAVNPSTGAYQFSNITPGEYIVIINDNDSLTDITPSLPDGYVRTEAPDGTRNVTLAPDVDSPNNNFGVFAGSKLTGNVFRDTGSGAATANNGVREAGESGIPNVRVSLLFDSTGNEIATTLTDADGNYTFFIRSSIGEQALRVVETNANATISTGGQAGNTGGTYVRLTDTTTFTNSVGSTFTGVDFGDVPLNTFTNDGVATTTPNNAVFYPHVFTAGSAGSVTFTTSSTQTPTDVNWTNVVYRDTNANGLIDEGEPILQPDDALAVVAGEKVAIIVKVSAPAEAPQGAKNVLTVNANFTYANATPTLTSVVSRTDTTTVGTVTGLQLQKVANTATALPGQNITYTITYTNTSDELMTNIVINDFTPGFTTFVSASAAAPPSGLLPPVITAPTVGGTGNVRWTFGGSLAPDATGSVTFVVKVAN